MAAHRTEPDVDQTPAFLARIRLGERNGGGGVAASGSTPQVLAQSHLITVAGGRREPMAREIGPMIPNAASSASGALVTI